MEPFPVMGQPFVLQLWREACRHEHLEAALPPLVAHLAPRLPAVSVAVRRIDLARRTIETLAAESTAGAPRPSLTRTDLTADDTDRVIAWWRGGRVVRGAPARDVLTGLLAPPRSEGDVLVGPLGE